MHPTIRSALVLLDGVTVSVVVVVLMDTLVGTMYPLADATDLNDRAGMARVITTMPTAAFLLLLAGWARFVRV